MAPIFFGYERTPLALKKVKIALDVFDTYLKRLGKKFSASGEYLSIMWQWQQTQDDSALPCLKSSHYT